MDNTLQMNNSKPKYNTKTYIFLIFRNQYNILKDRVSSTIMGIDPFDIQSLLSPLHVIIVFLLAYHPVHCISLNAAVGHHETNVDETNLIYGDAF